MGSAHTKVTQDTKVATNNGVKENYKRMHMASVVPKRGGSVDFMAERVLAFLDEMGCANSPVLFKTTDVHRGLFLGPIKGTVP